MTYCGRLGEESSELIAYLQAVPGVAPIHPGANPATWCAALRLTCSATLAPLVRPGAVLMSRAHQMSSLRLC